MQTLLAPVQTRVNTTRQSLLTTILLSLFTLYLTARTGVSRVLSVLPAPLQAVANALFKRVTNAPVLRRLGELLPCPALGVDDNPFGLQVSDQSIPIVTTTRIFRWNAGTVRVDEALDKYLLVGPLISNTDDATQRRADQGIQMYGPGLDPVNVFSFVSQPVNGRVLYRIEPGSAVNTVKGGGRTVTNDPDFTFEYNVNTEALFISMKTDYQDERVGQAVFNFGAYSRSDGTLLRTAAARLGPNDRSDRLAGYNSFSVVLFEQGSWFQGAQFFRCGQ